MRKLHTLFVAAVLALSGACVSFDPSGQPMADDVVEPEPEPDVDAGLTGTAPDAALETVDAEPDDPAAPDARPPDDDGDDDDNSGPGGGNSGPGGGDDDPGPGGGDDGDD